MGEAYEMLKSNDPDTAKLGWMLLMQQGYTCESVDRITFNDHSFGGVIYRYSSGKIIKTGIGKEEIVLEEPKTI